MCDTCNIVDEIGQEKFEAIAEAVEKNVTELYEMIIVSILEQLGVEEFSVTQDSAIRSRDGLSNGSIVLNDGPSEDGLSYSFKIERKEVSPEDRLNALFKSLFG